MDSAFIYWDNSNIFTGAQQVAVEREGQGARSRVYIHFGHLLDLARAGRPIEHATAVGSVPPELRHVWNRLENEGVTVQLLERGALHGREQGVDQALQTAMLRDGFDYNGNPGTAVMLTGDGAGFADGVGFHADLERMRRRGWRVEVLSWRHSCNRRMREWAEANGRFVTLDDFYESVTFLEVPAAGQPLAEPRHAVPVDLGKRIWPELTPDSSAGRSQPSPPTSGSGRDGRAPAPLSSPCRSAWPCRRGRRRWSGRV